MKTLEQFSKEQKTIQVTTAWYLSDIGEFRGKQELYTKQAPQKLKVLKEHALIESALSSNRIEGIEIDKKRIGTIMFGRPMLKDRNEEEVAGYKSALKLIHESTSSLHISEKTIKKIHTLTRGEVWDSGKYKEKDGDIIEKYPDGRQRIRFKTVSASQAPTYMRNLEPLWNQCLKEKWTHPLIAMAAYNLDFLCIHPFRDGNGRVSRLLMLLQCYHLGYEVGKYISLERLIEQNKDRYYETLEQSSKGWHEGKHDPWPYINYILYILKTAYKEFEEKARNVSSPKGSKTDIVMAAIKRKVGKFSIAEIQKECPGVSLDMLRLIFKNMKSQKMLKCLGRGKGAKWQLIG